MDGRDGLAGEPGRDALQVEVLERVDPAKKYGRGTWAAHQGGLVRAFKATVPLQALPDGAALEQAGWHVVVRGVAEVAVEASEDMRTLGLGLRLTDGELVLREFRLPVVIDRGVWKAASYAAGDGVTWGGSFWIAQRVTEAAEKPGDESGAFRLAVKKGSDGRDGVRGEKGERGAEGRAGRDLTQMGPNGERW